MIHHQTLDVNVNIDLVMIVDMVVIQTAFSPSMESSLKSSITPFLENFCLPVATLVKSSCFPSKRQTDVGVKYFGQATLSLLILPKYLLTCPIQGLH